jgi:hypothetical protein
MADSREQPLNDVARTIVVQSNYDPHFSGIEDRIIMETKLFLARLDALRLVSPGVEMMDLQTALKTGVRSIPDILKGNR